MTMAATIQMPGNWPLENSFEIDPNHELFLPISPVSPMSSITPPYPIEREHHVPVARLQPTQKTTSNAVDMAPASEPNSKMHSPSYLAFEPVVKSVTENMLIDWKRYEPPQELLNHPDDTSEEIRRILQSSIDTLQARHLEEEREREASARIAKPLGRSRRVSGRPKVEVT
jgi:hypothetical protein